MSKAVKTSWIYIGLLIVLTLPLCLGIFGTNLISAHDSMAGLIRALSMEKYMGHGQFLVRWAPEINFGYGYPMFNFYPPFFSFVSVLLFQFTHNMVLAIDLACSLFWILSGIGMFLLAREYWGAEGGMLSAILYVYAPYHIVDLYVRGAFAEFSSFALFPFLLLAIFKISRNAGFGYVLLGIVSVFVLSLIHNIMSMLFFPVAVFYMLYIFFSEKRSSWIVTTSAVFAVGLMMSSFFWLPALLEKKFLNLGFLISMRYDFHKSFISLGQLFWPCNNSNMDQVSFHAGLIHTLLCLFTLACLSRIFRINRAAGLGYVFFLIVGSLAVLFTLSGSHLFWEHIGILRYIQFPWRFLAIIVFSMSFLSGSAALLINKPVLKRGVLIITAIGGILISLNYAPKPVFVEKEKTVSDFLAMGEGEYTPKWVIIPPSGVPDRKFEIYNGKAKIASETELSPIEYETKVLALVPTTLFFHSFYFPGWRVYVDGQPTDPSLYNPLGRILFNVPAGEHDIRVVFGSTPVRDMAMIISWIGFTLLIGWVFISKFGKTRTNKVYIIILGLLVAGFAPLANAQTDEVSKYISFLKSPNPDIRMSAAEALGAIKDLRAVKPLIAILSDPDKGVRRSAARTLGFLSDSSSVEPLIAVLKDPEPSVRRCAVNALAYIKDDRAVEPLIALLKDKDPGIREDTVTALGRMKDIRAYEPLSDATKDPDINVKKAAEKALGIEEKSKPQGDASGAK